MAGSEETQIDDTALFGLYAHSDRVDLFHAPDIVLLLNKHGIIQDAKFFNEPLSECNSADWVGRTWADTVSANSRSIVEAILRERGTHNLSDECRVTHAGRDGIEVDVRYAAIFLDVIEYYIATGRVLPADRGSEEVLDMALFFRSPDAMVITKPDNLHIVAANIAAAEIFGRPANKLVGVPLPSLMGSANLEAMTEHLAGGDPESRPAASDLWLSIKGREYLFSESSCLYRKTRCRRFTLVPAQRNAPGSDTLPTHETLQKIIAKFPEGFVVIDQMGRVLSANHAFLKLVQLDSEAEATGHLVHRWIGLTEADMAALIRNLREQGAVRSIPSVAWSERGTQKRVELSAVSVPTGDPPGYGLVIRERSEQAPFPHLVRWSSRLLVQMKGMLGSISQAASPLLKRAAKQKSEVQQKRSYDQDPQSQDQ